MIIDTSGILLERITTGNGSAEKRGPEEWFDFCGSTHPRSRAFNSKLQKIKQRWQEAYSD